MDFVNIFCNSDKLRNGIITNAIEKILENVFTSYSHEYTFGTSSREMFYLFHEMMGSVEAVKTYLLNLRM